MNYDRDKLYRLLPEVYRNRDDGGALEALVGVLAEQAQVLEEDVRQLYDDLFIETCADWVVPYLGDLLGVTMLHTLADHEGDSAELRRLRAALAPRAQVANALPLRQRKGTAAALEQLATDVTGWRARVVELFRQVATSAAMNHPRPGIGLAAVRSRVSEAVGGPFDTFGKSVDIRGMVDRTRPHIPNVAVFLFRLRAHERSSWPATPVAIGQRHFRFSPLGADMALFHHEVPEPALAHLARRIHVPGPISPDAMAAELDAHYGRGRSVLLHVDGLDLLPLPGQTVADLVEVCDLGDYAGGGPPRWGFDPGDRYRIDPVRGRLLTPANRPPPQRLEVTFHEGGAADIGGGQYDRGAGTATPADLVIRGPGEPLNGRDRGVVELAHPGVYRGIPEITVAAGQQLTLRAEDGVFAQLAGAPLQIRGLGQGAGLVLDGLRLQGFLRVVGTMDEVVLRDCTLVPGRTLTADGQPQTAGQPSLQIETGATRVRLERCISGPLRGGPSTEWSLDASIVDAGDPTGVALSGLDGASRVGLLGARAVTIVGKVWTERVERVADSIVWARLAAAEWPAPVMVERRQDGHVCFSWVPQDGRLPAQHRCVPGPGDAFEPRFSSRRYGNAAYMQLSRSNPPALMGGASDESEMGAYHDLYQPLRETNLRARLSEFTRAGMDVELVFAT